MQVLDRGENALQAALPSRSPFSRASSARSAALAGAPFDLAGSRQRIRCWIAADCIGPRSHGAVGKSALFSDGTQQLALRVTSGTARGAAICPWQMRVLQPADRTNPHNNAH